MKYQGIIFDLDGVICSTDEYHYQAWKALADRLGISQSYISRLEKRILKTIKENLERIC